jgi:hypothetical protein
MTVATDKTNPPGTVFTSGSGALAQVGKGNTAANLLALISAPFKTEGKRPIHVYYGGTAPESAGTDSYSSAPIGSLFVRFVDAGSSPYTVTECELFIKESVGWKRVLTGPIGDPDTDVDQGALCVKHLDGAQFEALLNTTTNNLFHFNAGDIITKVEVRVTTAAGGAGVIDIGLDAALDGTTADPDGFLDGADGNAAGIYNSDNGTYDGADMVNKFYTCVGDGYMTITSSADLSASSIVGQVAVYYLPA